MEIRIINISQINIATYNPRKDLTINDSEYKAIKKSLNSFGLVEPLVWNQRTGNLVGGHQRLKVLMEDGITEVPVSIVDLDVEQEKALNIALNKIQGTWNYKKLAFLLDELVKIPDFNIDSIGFNKVEIGQIFDRYRTVPNPDDFNFEQEANKIAAAITQRGDRIRLGDHVLLCGDSHDPVDMAFLMGDSKANLLLTDPPYRVRYLNSMRPKNTRKWEPIYKDDLSQPEYETWLHQILTNIEPYLFPGAPFYIWNGFAQFPHMMQTLEGLNFQISCVITWVKETFAINFGDYHQGGEFALYGWKHTEKGAHPWYGGADQSTIWPIHRASTAQYEHPTTKPIELFARSIRNSSTRRDLVVDLFAGSGTAILASESLERRCFAMEIMPQYCDVIIRRFISFAPDKVSPEIKAKYIQGDRI